MDLVAMTEQLLQNFDDVLHYFLFSFTLMNKIKSLLHYMDDNRFVQ